MLKVYYQHGFNRPRTLALHEAMLAEGIESPFTDRLEEWKPDPAHDARITTRVPCGEYFEVRDRALIAHATQIDPDGFFFKAPLELQKRVWPTEEFELVVLPGGDASSRRTTCSPASAVATTWSPERLSS